MDILPLIIVIIILCYIALKSNSLGVIISSAIIGIILSLLFIYITDDIKIEVNYCHVCERNFLQKYNFCPFDGTELIIENIKENKR